MSVQETSQPLRTCIVCGISAWNEEQLKVFQKDARYEYGHTNRCIKCGNKYRDDRNKRLAEGFSKPLTCYFCGQQIYELKGTSGQSLFIHSLDGNHNNWDPANKVPAHSICHTKFHMIGLLIGPKNGMWKGDQATVPTQSARARRYQAKRGIAVAN